MIKAALLKKELENAMVSDVPTEEEQVYFRYTSVETGEEAIAKIQSNSSAIDQIQRITIPT